MDIKVPYLAEGVNSGTVVSILVSEGSIVKKNQTVLELETNKATAPIPATESGTVTKIHVKEGDEVAVGQALISIASAGTSGLRATAKETPKISVSSQSKYEATAAPKAQSFVSAQGREGVSGEYHYESKGGFPPPASPSVRKMAQQLGIDLSKVRGSEPGGRPLPPAGGRAVARRAERHGT